MNQTYFKCPSCADFSSDNLNSLRIHCQKRHGLLARSLYISLFLPSGQEPTCGCGCGEPTKFNSLQKGYSLYVLGHAARVSNNWGNNLDARAKSLETRRKEGRWSKDPWNRGKTKESDARLEKMGKTMSKLHGERYSKTMSENRLNGVVPTLTGSSHPNWKGGTSSIGVLCHSSNRLYRLWKFPALQRASFKCERCSSTESLHVHHSEMRMAEIIHACVPGLSEIGWEEQAAWVERVIDWHVEKSPAAEVLCRSCHGDEHPSLNFSAASLLD
jgi:hypothetical protein